MPLLQKEPISHVFKFRAQSYDFWARTHVMGILNVTPDSFSDGGSYFSVDQAVARGEQMVEEGADFIDIGGESSRPGSEPVSEEEELRRVLPVIEQLAKKTDIPLSIDTYKSNVARKALNAGAQVINDITGLTFDPNMLAVAGQLKACVVVMHMQGIPKTMQQEPRYDDVVGEVSHFLLGRAEVVKKQEIERIILDPGIGFGKTLEHNVALIKNLGRISAHGYPVLIGPSRKSFLGTLLDASVDDRLEGTAAAVAASILHGANIVRVHDVRQMRRVAIVSDALKSTQ